MAPASLVIEPIFVEAVYRFATALRPELAAVAQRRPQPQTTQPQQQAFDEQSAARVMELVAQEGAELTRVTYPDYVRSCWYFDKLHFHAFHLYVTVLPLHGDENKAVNLGHAAAVMGLSMTDLDDMQVRIGEVCLTRRLVRPNELAGMVVANAVGQVRACRAGLFHDSGSS